MILKKYNHNPPHYFQNNSIYFITGGTYKKIPFLNSNNKKKILLSNFHRFALEYHIKLIAWVILNNHYHLLIDVKFSEVVPQFFRKVHSRTAVVLNQIDNTSGRKVWWNYWDKYIENEDDFNTRLVYIFWNPVKHNYVEEPKDYDFSSYKEYISCYQVSSKIHLDLLVEDKY